MNPFSFKAARLVLEDGSEFAGVSFGAQKSAAGEVVFNTGMVGYNESLTDPSYEGQILSLTYPLIGNYGVPQFEKQRELNPFFESKKIFARALVVNNYSEKFNHWNAKTSLSDWLIKEQVPAITGIDTRALTIKLREKGVMLGKIILEKTKGSVYNLYMSRLRRDGNIPRALASTSHTQYGTKVSPDFAGEDIPFFDPNKKNLTKKVSCTQPITYGKKGKKILLIDCGVKNSIIRSLVKRNVAVIRVPFDFDFFENKTDFDAIVVSNGPGNPKTCFKTISLIKKALEKEIPIFGICLGHQLISLAIGADTFKLKHGHRSQNQPCVLTGTKKCYITPQNHGFAVSKKTLPKKWGEWFYNLNDNTNEGIRHKSMPFMSVQFHPEASPGPVDTGFLFDEFLRDVK